MSVMYVRGEDGKFYPVNTIKGEPGKDYVLTEADKAEIADAVLDSLPTETWTFELENGTTVTKQVIMR